MILYALACDDGHRFDSWFSDSTSYEDQAARGLVTCPTCLSTQTRKTIMAPAVMSPRVAAGENPVPAPSSEPAVASLVDERSREIRTLLRSMRDKLVADGHDVGSNFATEARRIHDGEAPDRQIYGQASIAEARDLLEDGIMVMPMPTLPDELN